MCSIRGVTVGLALAASLSTAAVGLAGAASAAPVRPAQAGKVVPVKGYRTWQAAQKAAGFPLLRPTRTFGLKLRGPGPINVVSCPQQVRAGVHVRRSRLVLASYGGAILPGAHIGFVQGLAGRARCPFPPVRRQIRIVAKIRVDGVIGLLGRGHGDVCVPGKCRSIVIWSLTWTKHRRFYQVMSPTKEGRMRVIGFARSLVPVS